MGTEHMERLNTASSFQGQGDPNLIKVQYKTGAQFQGKVIDHKRIGHGTFIWPNGSKYEGDFADNLRHGKGKQIWSDGTSYEGSFVNDLRHGKGHIKWSNGESYEGVFFKDRRHGRGKYTWPDGSSYEGTFYMDKKEGYGTFCFTNGDSFQGLYKEDEREGPGMVSHADGTQDVGLWRAEKLIKLCSEVKGAFSIRAHPQFEYKPEEHATYLDLSVENQSLEPIEGILHPPSALNYQPSADISQRVNELYSESLDPRSLAVNRHTFDYEFFKDMPKANKSPDHVKAWNATPAIIALQRHTLKHTVGKNTIGLNIDAIINFDRSKFKEKGPLEKESEELLEAAIAGNASQVETLLNSGKVHPDVSDRQGHTALIGAVVNWHIEVINVLLNHGADVNKLNDEGCSALSAGTLFYYPIEGFLYNIAERYMKPPPDIISSDSKQDSQPKGILANNKERRASRLNQINRIKSESFASARGGPKSVKLESDKSSVKILTTQPSGNIDAKNAMVAEWDEDDFKDMVDDDVDSAYGGDIDVNLKGVEDEEGEGPEDFESNQSLRNYHIEVTDQLVERCATQLSHNEHVVSRENSDVGEMSRARRLAIQMSHHERMKDTLDLLLKRGANPNAASVPMPVLFFAIKSADVEMVKLLLLKGADTNNKLSPEKGGLYPIHIACAIPGDEGVQITQLLLDALADPDARALDDDSFLNHTLEEEWSKDIITPESKALLGGRTALQIACAREDDYKNACKVVRLLLEHKADSSLLCNGLSPLALAIRSGNDLAIDELLLFGADPSLPLTHGVGSALCAGTTTEFEHQRTIQGRIQLVDKLIKAGANILAPIPIGLKRVTGTAVDYAYYMFNQDRRIAHMPYHALTHVERETYNARRKLLAHMGDILRSKAVEREKRRNIDEEKVGMRSQSPSANFVYIGAGAKLPPGMKSKAASKAGQGQVTFESEGKPGQDFVMGLENFQGPSPPRKPLFKYCYECGRSVAVRLAACTRCKEVYYCSKACKLKAWNARHKEECIRVGGRSRSPSPRHAPESPSGEKGKKAAQKSISGSNRTRSRDSVIPPRRVLSDSLRSEKRLQLRLSPGIKGGSCNVPNQRSSERKRDYFTSQNEQQKDHHGEMHERTEDDIAKFKEKKLLKERKENRYITPGDLPSMSLKSGKQQKYPRSFAQIRGGAALKLPPIISYRKIRASASKPLVNSAEHARRLANHRFRTGSPPNYEYVYIDNYSHN